MSSPIYDIVCSSSDRARWMRARHDGWGASEISDVVKGGRTTERKIREKAFGVQQNLDRVKHIRRGHVMENAIVRAFARQFDFECEPWGDMICAPLWPYLFATPDAYGPECGVVEIKCVKTFETDPFSDHRLFQLQQQLLVSGEKKGILVAMEMGDDYSMLERQHSDDELDGMAEVCRLKVHAVEAEDAYQKKIVKSGLSAWTAVERLRQAADKGILYVRQDLDYLAELEERKVK